jgi:Inhibitor of Apoptosis domain
MRRREDCRLASLLKAKWRNAALWQHMGIDMDMDTDIFQLARSGFYSENQPNNENQDEVVCFSCKTRVHSWEKGDIPDIEHERWAPECPYLRAKLQTGSIDADGNIPTNTEEPLPSDDGPEPNCGDELIDGDGGNT